MMLPAAVTRAPDSRGALLLALLLFCGLVVGGCARLDVIHLHLAGLTTEAPREMGPDALRVAIVPFDDRRGDTSFVGLRTPLVGDPQELHLETAHAGRLAAELMREVLRSQGWRAEVVGARAREEHAQADVVLTGELLELVVDADGSFLQTTIQAQSKVAIQALNMADGSMVRQTLTGLGTQRVFWFEPEDAEELVEGILLDSFMKLVSHTRVEGGTLHLK